MCRKNNVSEFIPDRQPDFPDRKFEKVSGDAFFVDESLLVTHLFFFLSFVCWIHTGCFLCPAVGESASTQRVDEYELYECIYNNTDFLLLPGVPYPGFPGSGDL